MQISYTKNILAIPRKIKNAKLSVVAVCNTLEPKAGSRPTFCNNKGTENPSIAAISNVVDIATAITRLREILPYNASANTPTDKPKITPFNKLIPISFF